MFLVELAHKTICQEIEDIKEQKNKTQQALNESTVNLRGDSAKLLDHIERDTSTTQEKTKQADLAKDERTKVEKFLDGLMNEINDTKQDIDKNKELLKIYQGHKDFMMQVYEENNESKKFK